jgi:hypothetical protein
MWKDPVVEEVRKARDDHAAYFNYDLQAIYRAFKEEEANSGRSFIRLSPKLIEKKKNHPLELKI